MTSKKPKQHDWERYLEIAAEAASVAMNLRDRPTRLDWGALLLSGISVGFRVRAERRSHMSRDPRDYFRDQGIDAEWLAVPDSLGQLVVRHVRSSKVVPSHWDGKSDSTRVVIGKLLGEEVVGWVADGEEEVVAGPYVRVDRQEETLAALGRSMWHSLGARHLVLGKEGIAADPFAQDKTPPAAQFRELLRRIERFRLRGVNRSFLLAGPPGTGKSTGIRFLARQLGGQSLRVELTVLARTFERNYMGSMLGSVELLVRALRPEVLIIDDIDRVASETELLQFLELAGSTCKLVLASANCTDKMTGALLRPGRFDELIEVDRPDPEIVRKLVGGNQELLSRLEGLPIAYIAEFVKRRDALGLESALAEIDELSARRKRAESD